jgi:hypothetical protein
LRGFCAVSALFPHYFRTISARFLRGFCAISAPELRENRIEPNLAWTKWSRRAKLQR